MTEVRDTVGRGTEEAALIIDEYKQRLLQFIEEEGKQIKGDAEQEAANIIAMAHEEAEKIRKEAEQESADIIARISFILIVTLLSSLS